ncbi:MAG: hydroxymethylbilane synthase [Rickettsiaceae bacterium]
MKIRLGTRSSKLALIQANLVADKIKQFTTDIEISIVPIITSGDKILDKSLYDIGGKALFIKELELALLNDEIDIAIHSLKDVPGILSNQFELAGVLEREDAMDVFISHVKLENLKHGALIGTSSMRRKLILQKYRPDLQFTHFRGNINKRMEKFYSNIIDATVMALAGLKRLGIFDKSYCYIIPLDQMIPSPGQGVIAMEIRNGDNAMQRICSDINHIRTWDVIKGERAFVEYLNASCDTPLAAHIQYLDSNKIKLQSMLSKPDGSNIEFYTSYGEVSDAKTLGIDAAKYLSNKVNDS